MDKHVCWNITPKCNAKCKFCYRITQTNELSLSTNRVILKNLINSKVKKISWTGGEPLLYKGINPLLKEAHENKIENTLISNGIIIDECNLNNFGKYIDYLTLPLDGISANNNPITFRGQNHYYKIIGILKYIKNSNYNFQIKINSLLSKVNMDEIIKIGNILEKYYISRWKIFRFIPLRNAYSVYDELTIDDREFDIIKCQIFNRFKDSNMKICFYDKEQIEKNYLLIKSDGDLVITRNSKDIILGNLLGEDFSKIKRKYKL